LGKRLIPFPSLKGKKDPPRGGKKEEREVIFLCEGEKKIF